MVILVSLREKFRSMGSWANTHLFSAVLAPLASTGQSQLSAEHQAGWAEDNRLTVPVSGEVSGFVDYFTILQGVSKGASRA